MNIDTVLAEIYRTIGRSARRSEDPNAQDHLQEALMASLKFLSADRIEKPKAYIGTAYRRKLNRRIAAENEVPVYNLEYKIPSNTMNPEQQAIAGCQLRQILKEKNNIDPSIPLHKIFGSETSGRLSAKDRTKACRIRKKIAEKFSEDLESRRLEIF